MTLLTKLKQFWQNLTGSGVRTYADDASVGQFDDERDLQGKNLPYPEGRSQVNYTW